MSSITNDNSNVDNNNVDNNNAEISNNIAVDNGETAASGNGTMAYSDIMAEQSPYAAEYNPSESEEEEDGDGEDDNTPGELERFVEDDSKVEPENRTAYYLMLGEGNVPDFNLDEFESLADRAGKKKQTKFTKAMAVTEIKRRNPRSKVNKNNKTLKELLNMLYALDEEKDIAYIRKKVAMVKKTFERIIAGKEANAPASSYLSRDDRLRWVGLDQRDDVLELFHKSQEPPTREELDAGETPTNIYHTTKVELFNDPSVEVILDAVPSLGYSDPIVCDLGDYVMTVEKSKKLQNNIRRDLNSIIDRYERSGNGSNQRAHNRGEIELAEGQTVDGMWGRTIYAAQDDETEDGNRVAQDETEDGDDRANFLRSEPKEMVLIWHLYDRLDMIRKVCARLVEGNGASSESTPASTARQSRSRKSKNRRQDEDKEDMKSILKEMATKMEKNDELFLRASKVRRLKQEQTDVSEALRKLKENKFELSIRAQVEKDSTVREMLEDRCDELAEEIDEMKEQLDTIKQLIDD